MTNKGYNPLIAVQWALAGKFDGWRGAVVTGNIEFKQ
jgi:hypothetical protein